MKIPLGIEPENPSTACEAPISEQKKSSFFSSLAARLFFLLLLLGDVLWFCYAIALLSLSFIGSLITLSRLKLFSELRDNALLTIRRSLVCGLSLFVALFSPAFGIMIACTYFLMYDRGGIDEIVPSSLKTQFKEFLPKE